MDQHQPPQREIHREADGRTLRAFARLATHSASLGGHGWTMFFRVGGWLCVVKKRMNCEWDIWYSTPVMVTRHHRTYSLVSFGETPAPRAQLATEWRWDGSWVGILLHLRQIKFYPFYWICMEFARVFATGWIEAIVLVYRMSRIYKWVVPRHSLSLWNG